MTTRFVLLLAGVLSVSANPALAQSRDPYFTTFSANYDFVYHEPGATSNAGAHFDVASTWKRDVPFIGPVGEVGFNHFDGGTIVSLMGCGVCDVNDFALQGGAGLDFRTSSPNVRIRVQFDIRLAFDSPSGFNAERLSVGVVLPLNK